MTDFDCESLHRAEEAEFHAVLRSALEKVTTEDVLLYNAEGRPILKGSDEWNVGEVEWRRLCHQLLNDVLDQLPPDRIPTSEEELIQLLGNLSESDPKYTFNIVDGKLSLPLSLSVGKIEFRGHIPVYRLLAILTAVIGGLSLAYKNRRTRAPALANPPATQPPHFALWRRVRLGTFGSWQEMDKARVKAHIWINTPVAKVMLKDVVLAAVPTEIPLVNVSVRELGFRERRAPLIINGPRVKEIYQQAAERGLALVPAEVGPQICLQYPNQADEVLIAMEPMDGLVFHLTQHLDARMLSAAFGGPDNVWGLNLRCVFSRRSGFTE